MVINITIMSADHRDSFEDLIRSRFNEYELRDGAPAEKGVRYTLVPQERYKSPDYEDGH